MAGSETLSLTRSRRTHYPPKPYLSTSSSTHLCCVGLLLLWKLDFHPGDQGSTCGRVRQQRFLHSWRWSDGRKSESSVPDSSRTPESPIDLSPFEILISPVVRGSSKWTWRHRAAKMVVISTMNSLHLDDPSTASEVCQHQS